MEVIVAMKSMLGGAFKDTVVGRQGRHFHVE